MTSLVKILRCPPEVEFVPLILYILRGKRQVLGQNSLIQHFQDIFYLNLRKVRFFFDFFLLLFVDQSDG